MRNIIPALPCIRPLPPKSRERKTYQPPQDRLFTSGHGGKWLIASLAQRCIPPPPPRLINQIPAKLAVGQLRSTARRDRSDVVVVTPRRNIRIDLRSCAHASPALTADRATIRTFVDAYKMAARLPNKACRSKCVQRRKTGGFDWGVICVAGTKIRGNIFLFDRGNK